MWLDVYCDCLIHVFDIIIESSHLVFEGNGCGVVYVFKINGALGAYVYVIDIPMVVAERPIC